MAKIEYCILLVSCSIDDIKEVAKRYNIELTKSECMPEDRGYTFEVDDENHPFVTYIYDLEENFKLLATRRYWAMRAPEINKDGTISI